MSKRVGRTAAVKLVALGVAFAAGFGTSSLRSSAMQSSTAITLPGVDETEAAELELVGTNVKPPTVTRRVQTGTGTARSVRAPAATPAGAIDARQIAQRALGFTVFVRGGGVYGAGVALDSSGHILTCDHVIDGVKELEVFFHGDPRPHPARVLDRDGRLDLALLQIDQAPSTLPTLSSVADAEMGDEVYAMGAPRKMTFSLGRGIVSYVGRSFDGTQHIQTDISANSGSSGGPLLNARGELVGISSFILRGSQGLAFAIPIDYAYRRFPVLRGGPDGKRFDRWLASRSGPDVSRQDFSGKAKRPASR